MVAGCAASASDAESKLSSFKDKVLSIISVAGQFKKMIGEVMLADFKVVVPHPLQTFEETTMEEDECGYDVADQKVLCLTHLGLTKRMQQESGKIDMFMVMKVRVVLIGIIPDYAGARRVM